MFLRIGEVRSLLHSSVNIRRDVSKIIGIRNELVVARLPSKTNITYYYNCAFEETF